MCTGFEPLILAVTAADKFAQGTAAKREAAYRASILDRQAERAEQEAAFAAAKLRRQGRRADAALRARLAASGVDAGTGSPLLAREMLAADAEFDALAALSRGGASASDLRAEGLLVRFRGDETARRSRVSASTNLVRLGDSLRREIYRSEK